jgi:hypothetical protein
MAIIQELIGEAANITIADRQIQAAQPLLKYNLVGPCVVTLLRVQYQFLL